MRFRKKPVVIEAIKFDTIKRNIMDEKLREFLNFENEVITVTYEDPDNPILEIETLEGTMKARLGDYIIKGVQGELYPCKPDIFHKTYEKVED